MLFLIAAEELRQTKDEMGAEAHGIGHDMPIFFNSSMGHGAFFGFLFFCVRDCRQSRHEISTDYNSSDWSWDGKSSPEINVFISKPRKFAA